MNTLRLSYTLLNTFMRYGESDRVVESYLHADAFDTPAMKRGREFDQMTRNHVEEKKTLPPELGGKKLNIPFGRFPSIIVSYDDMFDLKADIDTWDKPDLYEFKCSAVRDAADYARDFQVPFYFLVMDMHLREISGSKDERVEKAWIYRFDPILKQYDTALLWNAPRLQNRVRQLIAEHGPALYKFLDREGVL